MTVSLGCYIEEHKRHILSNEQRPYPLITHYSQLTAHYSSLTTLLVCGPIPAQIVELVVGQAGLSGSFLHKRFQFVQMCGVDVSRKGFVEGTQACGKTHNLAHHSGGTHHAHGSQTDVGYADVATSHEEVVYVAGVEASVGHGIGVGLSVGTDGFEFVPRKML